jgi:hypothetical protein
MSAAAIGCVGAQAARLFQLSFFFLCISFASLSAEPLISLNDALVRYARAEYLVALEMLLPLAEGGDLVAQEIVGFMYTRGEGVETDLVIAFAWLERAALGGRTEAQFELGRIYRERAAGLSEDGGPALFWFKRAAHQDAPHAMNAVGELYLGFGGAAAQQAAMAWFLCSAENGSWQAMLHIATMYRFGLGVEHDEIEEFKWIELAAREDGFLTFGTANIARTEMAARLTPAAVQKGSSRAKEWWRQARGPAGLAGDQVHAGHQRSCRPDASATVPHALLAEYRRGD